MVLRLAALLVSDQFSMHQWCLPSALSLCSEVIQRHEHTGLFTSVISLTPSLFANLIVMLERFVFTLSKDSEGLNDIF